VVGVDYGDRANQHTAQHRLFEYTDFFTRAVSVHTGDTLNFRATPGSFHIVALAPDETAGRAAYPVAFPDPLDKTPATGTGGPKISLGPSNFSITGGSTQGGGTIAQNPNGPPVCGTAIPGQQPCTFKGGDDVEVAGPNPGFDAQGNPVPADWKIVINAPPGKYSYFCYIHPGMDGTLTVVDPSQPATTQAQIDAAALTQFAADRDAALAVEQAANVPSFTGGAPGTRTYQIKVGVGTDKVAIDEMLPRQTPTLSPGDKVQYVWPDPHNVHTVSFPTNSKQLPGPFGFNCGTSFQSPPNGPPQAGAPPFQPCLLPGATRPDFIADPGNASAGSALTDPAAIVDAGVHFGTGYNVPGPQQWSIVVNGSTKAGTYNYQCTLHDWMQGSLAVVAGASVSSSPAQVPAQTAAQIPARMPNTGAGGTAPLFGGLALLGFLMIGLGTTRLATRR
jgi:plastocyanin